MILRLALVLVVGLSASAQAQDWQAGGGQKWADLLAAAKKEGKVAVAAPSPLANPLTEAFKRDTGIELDFLGGETRDLSARFNREARTNNVTLDLILSGGAQFPLLETGDLQSLKSQIVLPGSGDANWEGGKIKWMDSAGEYMLQATNFVLSYAVVNTDVTKGEFRNWRDLLKPQFKSKVIVHDPRAGGPGLGIATTLAESLGTDFIKQLFVDHDVKYSRDGRQLIEGVARGTYAVALGVSRTDIELFRKQFKNLDIVVPQDAPGTLVGSFSVLKQAKATTRPNASAVFVNWFASKNGQQVYSDAMDEPSLRKDISKERFPSYMLPQPGMKYIDQYEETWYQTKRAKIQEEVVKVLGGR